MLESLSPAENVISCRDKVDPAVGRNGGDPDQPGIAKEAGRQGGRHVNWKRQLRVDALGGHCPGRILGRLSNGTYYGRASPFQQGVGADGHRLPRNRRESLPRALPVLF